MKRDSIDFGTMKLGPLFRKQLFPTMLGMIASALFVITDGIFVGQGVGSDALAAVNVAAPLFMFSAAFGLMFGMGGAIVASINMSRGKQWVANINATQAVAVASATMLIVSIVVLLFPYATADLLGAPADIRPAVVEYLVAFIPFGIFHTLLNLLNFFTRIDGPKMAMTCMALAAGINIVLDYVFIFVFGWGLTGAAVATGIGEGVGSLLMLWYMIRKSPRVRLGRLKFSSKSMLLTARNSWYMAKTGFSAFLNQIAIAVMMLTGNYIFARYIGTDGIAAFGVVCYMFPVIYMIFDSIAQSAQPIISFNYGIGSRPRVGRVLKMAMVTALLIGTLFTVIGQFGGSPIVSLFITDGGSQAWQLADNGLKLFSLGFIFFGINIVSVGYLMSVEQITTAMRFTLFRGIIAPIICFFVLPLHFGTNGIWLAVPLAEMLTTLGLVIMAVIKCVPRHERPKATIGGNLPAG